MLHTNGNWKEAGGIMLISDKIEFKGKTIIRDKKGHYTAMKGLVQENTWELKNICTQHGCTSVCKANVNSHKKESK